MSKTKLKDCPLWGLKEKELGMREAVVGAVIMSCPNRRCEPERKEVLIQDKPTWLCGDCSRQWDVSGRETERTTDWYLKMLPWRIQGRWLSTGKNTKQFFADYSKDEECLRDSLYFGKTPTEALKSLWEWCVENGHVKEEKIENCLGCYKKSVHHTCGKEPKALIPKEAGEKE